MKIAAVIVTFQPDYTILKKNLSVLVSQVDFIIIVNNGYPFEKIDFSNLEIIDLYENTGIAKAQNIGIKHAIEKEYDYILFLDQDTLLPINYVKTMINHLENYSNKDFVASIAPCYINKINSSISPFLQIEDNKLKKKYYKNGLYNVFYTISSGQIIPTNIINKVGLMKEELFIDWVDIEWCIRAYNLGYENLQDADVIIEHTLGDKQTKFKNVTKHSNLRNMYLIRNGYYLLKYSDIPYYQKRIVKKILKKNILGILYSYKTNLLNELKLIFKALNYGKNKKMGIISE